MYRRWMKKVPRVFKCQKSEYDKHCGDYPPDEGVQKYYQINLSDRLEYPVPMGVNIGTTTSWNSWQYSYEKTTFGDLAKKLGMNVETLMENLHYED